MLRRNKAWACLAGTILLSVSLQAAEAPPPVSGRALTAETIVPADVLARAQWLREEVELLRKEMGAAESLQAEMPITGAAPREVLFQARTLYEKADRLAFEHTGTRSELAEPPPADTVRPVHVWELMNAALGRVWAVKEELGIPEQVRERPAPTETTPSQVFGSIIQAGRQLNLLLERRYAPRDVYREVSLSIHYAARLLGQYPGAERVPEPPALVRFKRPGDVYQALLDCFEAVRNLAVSQGHTVLEIQQDPGLVQQATPSDVYDMAVLLVSELAYLHAQGPGLEPPVPVYDPGRKFPSDVYQRVGLLRQQLQTLAERAGAGE